LHITHGNLRWNSAVQLFSTRMHSKSVVPHAIGAATIPTPHAPPLTLLPVAALCLSPDGRGVPEAHVKLPTELLGAFPEPAGDDARFLQEIAQRGSLDSQ